MLLSPKLQKFKQIGKNKWNFRCPLCGDSNKNKRKARGYAFEYKGTILTKCHNCGVSLPIEKLIETMDPVMAKEYRLEKFKESSKPRISQKEFIKKVSSTTKSFDKDILSTLTPIDSLNKNHIAKEYLLNRKLPTECLYYTDNFMEWTNSIIPTFDDITYDHPRIIIPLIDQNGIVFGWQGRALSPYQLRYLTILLDDNHTKVFGLDRIDSNKTIYITEGPFDSLLLDNSIAMAGSDLADFPYLNDRDCVLVYDNEFRSRAITNRMSNAITAGKSIVIWPSTVKEKDINDMYLAGYDVNQLVKENTYSGLKAQLLFNKWKRI